MEYDVIYEWNEFKIEMVKSTPKEIVKEGSKEVKKKSKKHVMKLRKGKEKSSWLTMT